MLDLDNLTGRVDSNIDFTAIAGVVSAFAAAITAWQSESGASRKINRYTNAVVALKNRECLPLLLNHVGSCCRTIDERLLRRDAADQSWWNGLTPVDQNSQANINTLVTVTEYIKLTEVNAWADASRQKEHPDDGDQQAEPATKVDNPMFAADD